MSLGRRSVAWVECTVSDDARREPSNGSTRADSDAAGDLTRSGISYSRSAQDCEILSGSECLCFRLGCESRQRGEGEEE